jgi:predicted nucleotidyltransferase
MTTDLRLLLGEVRAGLKQLYDARLRGVYLFGSYARGDFDAESDCDLLIVLDALPRYGAEVDRTGELISGLALRQGATSC